MKSDVEIAQEAELEPMVDIASKIDLSEDDIEPRGNYKAKLSMDTIRRYRDGGNGKLVLVTTMTPTRGGEGKTTVTIGLAQALWRKDEKTLLGIREPSIGPTMGIKGGAAGGGYSQVLPMEDINLHFTGDLHAIGTAHNLLSAMINNHLHRGNELNIDPRRVVWPRVVDMNDRALRTTVVGLGGKAHGMPMENSFGITASSEVMAILCLANGLTDLKERLSRMIIGYTFKNEPITASDIGGVGAMGALMKHAVKPNLVQTIEGGPAFIHGGPFANIAHGTSSLISTKVGLSLADYFITEAGFGSDLGAEKFFDIVCREGDLSPDAVVMVATVRALKRQGGSKDLKKEDLDAMKKGLVNLSKHLENVQMFGLPVIVAINRFPSDTDREISHLEELCDNIEVPYAVVDVHKKGGEGGLELADEVITICDKKISRFSPLYSLKEDPRDKIYDIATKIYGAKDVVYTQQAGRDLRLIERMGLGELPICMVKTHSSLSDDRKLRGRPTGFEIKIRAVNVSAGAGFLIPMAGDITTMPGLPRRPAAVNIDVDEDGRITGLF
ncbi:MAG: formate--tetrahydrofolate ligase [Thermoplasmata archaeon]